MRPAARAVDGYTLIELVLSLALGSIVLIGLSNLMVPLTRAQILASRGQTAQLALVSAQSATERALRQATWLRSPSIPGLAADRLEGCENAQVEPGANPTPVDSSRPMRWFAFCAQDGVVYDHAGEGCPPRYLCGLKPLGSFGGGSLTAGATIQFTRASAYSTVVEVDLAFTSGEASSRAKSAVAFAAAAGSNQ